MPEPAMFLAFLAAVIVMQATPGPDMMLVMSRGIGEGRRAAWWTVVGFMLAGLVQVPLLASGVGALVAAHPLALDALRLAGGAYLVWLGLRLILDGDPNGEMRARPASAARAMREGMINNLTKPKSLMFMLAFLPQFVDPARGSVTLQLAVLGITQKLSGLVIQGAVASGAGTLGAFLARRPSFVLWQARLAGAVMVGPGLRLLVGDGRTRS